MWRCAMVGRLNAPLAAILAIPAAAILAIPAAAILGIPVAGLLARAEEAPLLETAQAAAGGEAAFAAVDNLSVSGELVAPGAQSGDILIELAPPGRFKTTERLMLPMIGSAEVVRVLNGAHAWTESRKRAALPGSRIIEDDQPEEALRRDLQMELAIDSLAWLLRPEPSFLQAFERDPEAEQREGGKSAVLEANDPRGLAVRLFLDPKTNRLRKIQDRARRGRPCRPSPASRSGPAVAERPSGCRLVRSAPRRGWWTSSSVTSSSSRAFSWRIGWRSGWGATSSTNCA